METTTPAIPNPTATMRTRTESGFDKPPEPKTCKLELSHHKNPNMTTAIADPTTSSTKPAFPSCSTAPLWVLDDCAVRLGVLTGCCLVRVSGTGDLKVGLQSAARPQC